MPGSPRSCPSPASAPDCPLLAAPECQAGWGWRSLCSDAPRVRPALALLPARSHRARATSQDAPCCCPSHLHPHLQAPLLLAESAPP